MKKLISFLIALCLIASLAGCGSKTETVKSEENETQTESIASETKESETKESETKESETKESEKTPKKSDEKIGAFNKSATIPETVMVDEAGVKITATGLNYGNYSVELELVLENNSGKDLSFISGSMGYSCNSVNGYMVQNGYLNCDVANGKKAIDSIDFDYNGLMLYGINEISDIEIGFYVSDDDYEHTYFEPRQVKSTAFDSHNYSDDCYKKTITSNAAMNTFDYELICFSEDALYNVNGVNMLSGGIMKNQDGNFSLLLEMENTTDSIVHLYTSDIAINGLLVNTSLWSSDEINPGKRAIIDVDIESVLQSEYRSIYGIKEPGSVSLSLGQKDSDGKDISEKTPVEIVVPDVKAEFDATGKEVYNANGFRIVSKAVIDDPSDYSSNISILLFAENKSGNTLTIDDVYDSVSVNGFMTSYYCYGKEIPDGGCAVIEIELTESSLEDNKISSASDISDVEIGFEIKEGRNTVDEPVVKILFD